MAAPPLFKPERRLDLEKGDINAFETYRILGTFGTSKFEDTFEYMCSEDRNELLGAAMWIRRSHSFGCEWWPTK